MPSSTLSVLGKYQILAEIGRGGFATVFRARDLDLSRDVALKVLDPLLVRDPVWVARFRREARAVAGLDHPRIVTIYEIGQAEGALYIAMKLLEGGSLAQRLAQQGPLPWPEVVRITGEIAEALDYAHGQGVLHRDLKPGNVLLDPRNGAVLTDFGFARLVADNSLSISMSGGLVGTPAYIAPEIWEGQDATAQTDIYALGCILYELVTGRTLFTGATPPAIMMAHFQPRAMPEAWPEGTPPGLSEVLRTALVRDPVARYARAGDLTAAIAALSVDPLAEPYASLEAAIVDSEWQPALALAAEIRSQRSDYRDVIALEQRALAGVAQAAREQQAAQWRHSAEEALASGNLTGVKLALTQWQQLMPEDPELARLRVQLQVQQVSAGPVAAAGSEERGMGNIQPQVEVTNPPPPPIVPPASSAPIEHPPAHGRGTRLLLAGVGTLASVVVLVMALRGGNGRSVSGVAIAPGTDTPVGAAISASSAAVEPTATLESPTDAAVKPTDNPIPPTNAPVPATSTPAPPTKPATPRPTATPAKTPTPLPDAVVNVATVNLRDGPGTTYDQLGNYRRGTVVSVVGKNTASDWLKVKMPDGKTGWMARSLLKVNANLGQMAVVAVSPTATFELAGTPARVTRIPTETPQLVFQYSGSYPAGGYVDWNSYPFTAVAGTYSILITTGENDSSCYLNWQVRPASQTDGEAPWWGFSNVSTTFTVSESGEYVVYAARSWPGRPYQCQAFNYVIALSRS